MTYQEIYQRNIGLFTQEEQDRLKNTKVAIAGVGGLVTLKDLNYE